MRRLEVVISRLKPWRHVFHLLLLALLVYWTYHQCLGYEFVWDDHALIVDNRALHDISAWPSVFTRSFWELGDNMGDPNRDFYRPVISLSYMLEYAWRGLDAHGYHATNVVVHGLAVWALYWLGFVLFSRAGPACLAAAIFAVHPTHVENVCWVSGRTDLFCGLFFFLALTLFIVWFSKTNASRWLLVSGFFALLLGLMSKEVAITLPVVLSLWLAISGPRPLSRRKVTTLAITVTIPVVLFFLARLLVLAGGRHVTVFNQFDDKGPLLPIVFARYLGLLVGLHPLDMHHGSDAFADEWIPSFIVSCAVVTGYLLAGTWFVRCKWGVAAFCMAWIPAVLLPVFNFGSFGDISYADRFLYIPSAGFALGIPALAALPIWGRIIPSRAIRITAGCGLGVLMFGGFIVANKSYAAFWRDPIVLFSRALQTSPTSSYIAFNLGVAYQNAGQHERAIRLFQKAIRHDPKHAEAYCNIGVSLNKMGKYREGLRYLVHSAQLLFDNYVVHYNLGDAYRALGRHDLARRCYAISLAMRDTAEAQNDLGESYLVGGDYRRARRHLEAALRFGPSPFVYNNLGFLALEEGRVPEAVKYLTMALNFPAELISGAYEVSIRYNLARALLRSGNSVLAATQAGEALRCMAACGRERDSASMAGMRKELEAMIGARSPDGTELSE